MGDNIIICVIDICFLFNMKKEKNVICGLIVFCNLDILLRCCFENIYFNWNMLMKN